MAAGRPNRIIRVLIADESQLSCQSLKTYLEKSCKNVQIAGSALNQAELMKALVTASIDVALIGEGFMGGASNQTLRSIHHQFPQTKLIALLKQLDAGPIVFAFRSGVRGVFDHSGKIQSLCKCIQVVHKGQIWADSKDLQHITEELMTLAYRKT